ncbi:MAG TPA: DUF1707 domain-containing protein [Solirubrobacteraceae bacterium]|jgi:hypothetical protein|nr:DUF1707 domain-containing protein [Solirubrobacteraceae bacterium]
MTDPSGLRVSDAERDQAAGDLRDHYAAGRISSDELSERLDAVYAAQTQSELARLRGDLPELHPVARPDPRRELARRRLYQDAGGVVLANIGCVGVWAATGAHGVFWPVWVMLLSVLRLGRDGWRLFGPGGALETGAGDDVLRGDDRRQRHDDRHARQLARRDERAGGDGGLGRRRR